MRHVAREIKTDHERDPQRSERLSQHERGGEEKRGGREKDREKSIEISRELEG